MRTKLAVALVIAVVLLSAMVLAQTAPTTPRTPTAARTMPQVLPSNARVLQGEKILIDGKALSPALAPIMVGKTLMVPALPVFKQLNATPKWDARTQTLIGSARGQEIWVKGGDKNARLGRKTERLSETPFVYRSELYVPLDFVGSALDVKTSYDAKRKEVMIAAPTRPRPSAQALPKGGRLLAGTSIVVDGRRIASAAPAVMLGKAVMVPAHPVLQDLGAKPVWDARTERLTADVKGKPYVFTANDRTAGIAGHGVKLVQAPFVYDNQLYLAMDDVGRLFGTHVAYQSRQKQIVINTVGGARTTTQRGMPRPG